ncbi:signal recognition particle-docking protein FtsY [Anatilimnocola sp. NA78]|uniref:signal recognition particle-docking protein FtsY n=1 Tax=Anatilimnocola sp. NA78 TaxID=3415683 RepID=UPI003CE49F02
MGLFDYFKKKPDEPASQEKPAVAPAPANQGEGASQQGIFARLQTALKKTHDVLNTDIRDLFKREGRLVDDEFLTELFAALVKTDMGVGPATKLRNRVATDFRARVVHMSDVLAAVKQELRSILDQPGQQQQINFVESGPTVILVVGVNGSGKTTTIAKLCQRFKDQGKKVVLGAGDTFRAAAVEQLTIWADRLGAEIVKADPGADPASVAHRAVAKAVEVNADICIVDTAGRLQTQSNLMQQLEKIHRVMGKLIPEAPHEVLLVLDGTAGQNAISQAQGFSTAAKCTGIVLTKLDGTAKGGVVVAIREKFAIPVKFVGLGEKAADLAEFNAQQFVDALFENLV